MMSNELKPPERYQHPARWGHTPLPVAAGAGEVGYRHPEEFGPAVTPSPGPDHSVLR